MWGLRPALYYIIKPDRASVFQFLTFNFQLSTFCRADSSTNCQFVSQKNPRTGSDRPGIAVCLSLISLIVAFHDVVAPQHAEEGAEQDLRVKGKADLVQVLLVIADLVLRADPVASVDLRQTRNASVPFNVTSISLSKNPVIIITETLLRSSAARRRNAPCYVMEY